MPLIMGNGYGDVIYAFLLPIGRGSRCEKSIILSVPNIAYELSEPLPFSRRAEESQ